MARITSLTDFLTDVADAIRTKTGGTEEIPAANFDTEIESITIPEIETGKTAAPATTVQTITPSTGYDAMASVTIAAVTSAIDSNIAPNNIKAGVTILGVEGNVEPDKPDQTKTVIPTTEEQEIYADTGYELGKVVVEAVTADIDENITAENIAQNITILGVTGTYDGGVAEALGGAY